MSDLRRERQVKAMVPSLVYRIISIARNKWKRIFLFLGVPGLADLLREFLRAKTMDWIYERLGPFGLWLLNYKLALFTTALVISLLVIVVAAIRESWKPHESVILDVNGR